MTKLCKVTIGKRSFAARPGDCLLDAALIGGYDLPHECRSGRCGSCIVRVLEGHAIGGEGAMPGTVHACQSVVLSDLILSHDPAPPVGEHDGEVVGVAQLSRDVAEVTIATAEPLTYLPGQYANVCFHGYPWRAYSPTVAFDGNDRRGTFRLHIKRLAGGRVSSEIGRGIRAGHAVAITGPYGASFFRPGYRNRLVLFAGGTGFAPIWAIADAALRESALRHIVIVAAARSIQSFYMVPALERMSPCQNVVIMPVVGEQHSLSPHLRTGQATDFASVIALGDIVHAAGAPAMVEALAVQAEAAGAAFYADAFTPSPETEDGWLAQAAKRVGTAGRRLLAQPYSRPQAVQSP